MLRILKSIVPVILLVFILLLPCFVLASDSPTDKLISVGSDSGYNTNSGNSSLPEIVGKIIRVVLTLLGIVFLGLIVYAGFIWMIAAGNEDKVTRSKDTMRRALIGLIIVVGAYAISQFVVYSILK